MMIGMEVKETVLEFFQKKVKPLGKTEKEKLECRYLDIGILDSMQMVEMVIEFEKKFDVRFSVDDMQSPEFRTIGGLIEIIQRLRRNV